MGSSEDSGHTLIYVRNDETGESAYFDYTAADKSGDPTFLQRVTQGRIEAHASLTIVTDAKQEQAILDGIKGAQKGVPDFSLLSSTCSSNSARLLALGGINVAGASGFEGPKDLWQTAFSQYGDRAANAAEPLKPNANPLFPPIGKVHGLDDNPILNREYGHDPRGQARRLDRNAVNNNVNLIFRGGKLIRTSKKDLN